MKEWCMERWIATIFLIVIALIVINSAIVDICNTILKIKKMKYFTKEPPKDGAAGK